MDQEVGRPASGQPAGHEQSRSTASLPSGDHQAQGDLGALASGILRLNGDPIEPNSDDEWELEQRAFQTANRSDLPDDVRKVVRDLWFHFCLRERWYRGTISSRPRLRLASVDTRPQGGDSPQSEAPFTGSAVPLAADAHPSPGDPS